MAEPRESALEGCDHKVSADGSRGVFAKASFKTADFSKHKVSSEEKCVICGTIYHFWEDHVVRSNDAVAFDGSKTPKIDSSIASRSQKDLDLVLFEGELGEAYHVLMCKLLLKWDRSDTVVHATIITSMEKGQSEIEKLYQWYQIHLREPTKEIASLPEETQRGRFESKKRATAIVTSAFESCLQRSTKQTQQASSPWPDQAAIFDCFRAMLDAIYGSLDGGLDIHADYFRPSYSGKYWLNRYLRLTQGQSLPERKDVTNLAVIHYRRDVKYEAGRVTDKETVAYIAKAIQRANFRANRTQESRFSHVLLYGDFEVEDGPQLKKEVEDAFRKAKSEIAKAFRDAKPGWSTKEGCAVRDCKAARRTKLADHCKAEIHSVDQKITVLYVSRPWLARGEGEQEEKKRQQKRKKDRTADEAHGLWRRFRSDPPTLQVKVLSIWTALCKRYGPHLCVIGNRSGFIEGAAFVGIPVFYLNNERPSSHEAAGDTIWKPVSADHSESDETKRLQKLANVMNTLIPLYVLVKVADSKASGSPESKKPTAQASKLRGPQHKDSRPSGPSKEPSSEKRVDAKYEDELMAALFMYMCCSLEPSRYKRNTDVRKPGWTARVDMMHDQCTHPVSECGDVETFEFLLDVFKQREFPPSWQQMPGETLPEVSSGEVQEAIRMLKPSSADPPLAGLEANTVSPAAFDEAAVKLYRDDPTDEECRHRLVDMFTLASNDRQRQTGQEWLRRRFHLAVNTKLLRDGGLEHGLMLQKWPPVYGPKKAIEKPSEPSTLEQLLDGTFEDLRSLGEEEEPTDSEAIQGPQLGVPRFDPDRSTIYCIEEMSSFLRENMFQLRRSEAASAFNTRKASRVIPWPVKYACHNWVQHFANEKITPPWLVGRFLRTHLLHWLEVMSLLGKLSQVKNILTVLETALEESIFQEDSISVLRFVRRARIELHRDMTAPRAAGNSSTLDGSGKSRDKILRSPVRFPLSLYESPTILERITSTDPERSGT